MSPTMPESESNGYQSLAAPPQTSLQNPTAIVRRSPTMPESERNGYQSLAAPPLTSPENFLDEIRTNEPGENQGDKKFVIQAEDSQAPLASEKNAQPQTRSRKKLDKQVPLVMGFSVVFAIIFALIHHLFYRYWNERVVASDNQQRWITRGGTLFAYGFKTALVAGSGAAYVQYLWMSMRVRPFRAGEIDSLFSVLTSALQFVYLRFWFRAPFLALVAIITWLIPLAAIITPGTLVVSTVQRNSSAAQIVPSLNFQNYASSYGSRLSGAGIGQFGSASNEVVRLAFASATSGTILSMTPPAPNSTYTLMFYGPALSCEKANDTEFMIMSNLAQNYSDSTGSIWATFLAWIPQSSYGCAYQGFCETEEISDAIDRDYGTNGSQVNVFLNGDSPVLLYCSLRNVSYTVDFEFESNQQTKNIRSTGNSDPVTQWNAGDDTTDGAIINKTASYLSVMFAFNKIILGLIGVADSTGGTVYSDTMIQSTNIAPLLDSPGNDTIARGLEDMFQNITFSLFSSPNLLADAGNASQAVSVDVSTNRTQNIYVYDPLDLYLAYGIALVCALVCLGAGCFALTENGVSYTNQFSTILRATRDAEFDHLVAEGERDGANPNPKGVSEALLSYHLSDDRNAGFQLAKD